MIDELQQRASTAPPPQAATLQSAKELLSRVSRLADTDALLRTSFVDILDVYEVCS
jgi:hypothetical protein